jgi:hypothetical protein
MKMFACKFAQDEVTHQRLRVGSKSPSSKAAAIFTRGAYAEYVSTGKWRPACAKPLRRRQGTPLAAFFNRPILATQPSPPLIISLNSSP